MMVLGFRRGDRWKPYSTERRPRPTTSQHHAQHDTKTQHGLGTTRQQMLIFCKLRL